ncbi:MAG TPA: molybdopterin cofactor-binding domain-containing protein [Sphaerochaeta sp.]|nr:molybdopterin cofactor-binding domain-containing protein [Sphaerochaeta sp.]
MAKSSASISKHGTLQGLIIRSTIERGTIRKITLPELDNRFVVIATRDITGTNRLRINDVTMPLLTSSTVSYLGQPILVLFGPDTELVRFAAEDIEIEYEELTEEHPFEEPTPYTWSSGSIEDILEATEDLQNIERTYRFGHSETTNNTFTTITASFDGEELIISVPTQWPQHVRDTVSDVTGIAKRKITIIPESAHAPYDELLITPSAVAALAALAAIKSESDAQLRTIINSSRPQIDIQRKSYYAPDGKVHAEVIEVLVDQGSALFFSDEMANHIIAGLTPIYSLEAISISISFTQSSQQPAHFYGDLGYSDALACTEAHYTALSTLTGYNPVTWRIKHIGDDKAHQQTVKTDRASKLKALIEEVSQSSDFLRKHAVYEMQTKSKLSTFLNYSRGIGLCCAAGISGFSSECKQLVQQAMQLTLLPNDKVEMNTSLSTAGSSADLWKDIISEELAIEKNEISFVTDYAEIIDSGPAVLAVATGRMPQQIKRACDLIKEKRFVDPLPISEHLSSSRIAGANAPLFISHTWVTVVIELEIDTILLTPTVRSIWTSLAISKSQDEQVVRTKTRRAIVRALREVGVSLSQSGAPEITINITAESERMNTSINSGVKAALSGAFLAAVDQALGTPITTLPVDGNVVLAALKGKA